MSDGIQELCILRREVRPDSRTAELQKFRLRASTGGSDDTDEDALGLQSLLCFAERQRPWAVVPRGKIEDAETLNPLFNGPDFGEIVCLLKAPIGYMVQALD